jgi:hypothetical protein
MSIARGNYTSSGNLPSARIDKPDPPEHLQTPHQLTIVGKVGRHPQRIRKAGRNDTSAYNNDKSNHSCHAHTNTIPCPYHKPHDSAQLSPWSIRRKVRDIRKARLWTLQEVDVMKTKDLHEMVAGGRPGDDRLGPRPLFPLSWTAEPFSRKPVHKRATYRDNLVSSLDFSRAAGDMGLETGLSSSSSPGGTWQVEASGDGVDSMVSC